MNKKDTLIVTACLIQLGVCVAVGAKVFFEKPIDPNALDTTSLQSPQLVNVSPNVVIGDHPTYVGNPSAAFTLVEFGDFQCPPCAAADPKIKKALHKFGQKNLRFTFRNLPLTRMHPYSYDAAIGAERARIEGKYWPVHDGFYSQNAKFDKDTIAHVLANSDVAMESNIVDNETKSAQAVIKEDILTATELDIQSTPSFFLCCSDGRVMKLAAPKQVSQFLSLP